MLGTGMHAGGKWRNVQCSTETGYFMCVYKSNSSHAGTHNHSCDLPLLLMFCASMHGACSFSAHCFVDTIMNLVIVSVYSVTYSVVLCSFDNPL